MSSSDHLHWAARLMEHAAPIVDSLSNPALLRWLVAPLGALAALATRRHPVSAGGQASRPPQPAEGLVALTANLHHDWPRHRRLTERLELFAELAEQEGASILLLQEVMRRADFCAAAWLARRLDMAYVYAPANGHRDALGFEEGLAILSRYPIEANAVQTFGLENGSIVRRVALAAKLSTPLGSLWAFSAHLSLRPRRNRAQLRRLERWVADLAGGLPALIGGDFNAIERSVQMQRAQQIWLDAYRVWHPDGRESTHALGGPLGKKMFPRRLDYLFLRPGSSLWRIAGAEHPQRPDGRHHSDHRPVLARLTV